MANPERNLTSRITMLELFSRPVYLERRRGAMEAGSVQEYPKHIREPDLYPVFISRSMVARAAVLAQLADSETSKDKVLTSGGTGML